MQGIDLYVGKQLLEPCFMKVTKQRATFRFKHNPSLESYVNYSFTVLLYKSVSKQSLHKTIQFKGEVLQLNKLLTGVWHLDIKIAN